MSDDSIKPLPLPLQSMNHYADFEAEFGALIEGIVDMFKQVPNKEDPDILNVHQAEENVRQTTRKWKVDVDRKKDELREISRSHNQLKLSSFRSLQPTTETHEAQMASAQADLIAALKNNSELEQNRNRLQADLERLQMELKEEEGEAFDVGELNAEVMRIKLYREFGFTPLEESGVFNKFIVRSKNSMDVRTIQIDQKSPDFFWSNYLWESLSA